MVNADFERCTDFLARMIEKYGGELDLPKTEENDRPTLNDVFLELTGKELRDNVYT